MATNSISRGSLSPYQTVPVVNSEASVGGDLLGTGRALQSARLTGNASERKGEVLIVGSGRRCNRHGWQENQRKPGRRSSPFRESSHKELISNLNGFRKAAVLHLTIASAKGFA